MKVNCLLRVHIFLVIDICTLLIEIRRYPFIMRNQYWTSIAKVLLIPDREGVFEYELKRMLQEIAESSATIGEVRRREIDQQSVHECRRALQTSLQWSSLLPSARCIALSSSAAADRLLVRDVLATITRLHPARNDLGDSRTAARSGSCC